MFETIPINEIVSNENLQEICKNPPVGYITIIYMIIDMYDTTDILEAVKVVTDRNIRHVTYFKFIYEHNMLSRDGVGNAIFIDNRSGSPKGFVVHDYHDVPKVINRI